MTQTQRRDYQKALVALLHQHRDTDGLTAAEVALHLELPAQEAERLLREVVARDTARMTVGDELLDLQLPTTRYGSALNAAPPLAAMAALDAVRGHAPTPGVRAEGRKRRMWVLGIVTLAAALAFAMIAPPKPRTRTPPAASLRPESAPVRAAEALESGPSAVAPSVPVRALPPITGDPALTDLRTALLAASATSERTAESRALDETGAALRRALATCAPRWEAAPEQRCYSAGRLLSRDELAAELLWTVRAGRLNNPPRVGQSIDRMR